MRRIVALYDRAADRFFTNEQRAERAVTAAAWSWAGGFTALAFFL